MTGRVVLLTGHYFESQRRAGFHWLAESYWRRGWDVTFATVSLSWLSWLRRDYRLAYPVGAEANRLKQVRERLHSYVLRTAYHPANLRSNVLNRLSLSFFRRYGRAKLGALGEAIAGADLVIVESTPGLLLVPQARALNPAARFVYRVSDDLRLLRSHPAVIEAEAAFAPSFDLVSVPSSYLYERFAGLANLRLDYHGVETEAFDGCGAANPYRQEAAPNVVFAGTSHFDYDFLEQATALFPDWRFHVIGPIPGLTPKPNLALYGELPFAETVPYIRHADAGLQIRAYSPGAESLSDSLKVLQYSYCGLGVVAPQFLGSRRPNVFAYDPGDSQSIGTALEAAVAYDGSEEAARGIGSWDDLAKRLAAA